MLNRDHNHGMPNAWLQVIGFIVVLWAAASDAMAQARDVLVTEVRGTVVKNAVKGVTPVRALDNLKAGDRVRLSSDSHLGLFASSDALLYTVDGPAEVVVGPKGITANGKPAASSRLDEAYRNIKVNAPELVQGSLVMRGASAARVEGPEGIVAVSDARRFQWRGQESAWRFELATDDGKLVHRAEVRGNGYVLPDVVALEPGVKYVWGIGPVAADAPSADWTEFIVDANAPPRAEPTQRLIHAAWLNARGLHRPAQRLLEEPSAR
jgi:hypothetical protein